MPSQDILSALQAADTAKDTVANATADKQTADTNLTIAQERVAAADSALHDANSDLAAKKQAVLDLISSSY